MSCPEPPRLGLHGNIILAEGNIPVLVFEENPVFKWFREGLVFTRWLALKVTYQSDITTGHALIVPLCKKRRSFSLARRK